MSMAAARRYTKIQRATKIPLTFSVKRQLFVVQVRQFFVVPHNKQRKHDGGTCFNQYVCFPASFNGPAAEYSAKAMHARIVLPGSCLK
jgi:hypothetical protein